MQPGTPTRQPPACIDHGNRRLTRTDDEPDQCGLVVATAAPDTGADRSGHPQSADQGKTIQRSVSHQAYCGCTVERGLAYSTAIRVSATCSAQ